MAVALTRFRTSHSDKCTWMEHVHSWYACIILQMSLTCWVKLEPKFLCPNPTTPMFSLVHMIRADKVGSVQAPKQKSENSRLPTCSNFAHCMHADHQIFLSWLPIPKWVTTHSTQMVSLCVDKKHQTLCCCCYFFFFISFLLLLLCLQVKRLRLLRIICTSDDGYSSGS